MIEDDEPPPLVGCDTITSASCLTTILALPMMAGIFVMIAYAMDPQQLGLVDAGILLVSVPVLLIVGALGAVAVPWSAAAALILTMLATTFITRRKHFELGGPARPWLLAGLAIGLAIATAILFEGVPISETVSNVAVLISGALTGMAAMLVCRHLVRSFEG